MRFDPIKKEVYSDQGEFIKKMNCPYKLNWVSLEATNTASRKCSNCDRYPALSEFWIKYEQLRFPDRYNLNDLQEDSDEEFEG